MSSLTLFGMLAVSAMLLFYALEQRARVYVLLFAAACAASSVYGFLQGAWPFGIVEAIWTGVAIRRWSARTATRVDSAPIACDMTALSRQERERYDMLRSRVLAGVEAVTATDASLQFRIASSVTAQEIAEWMALEHRCCPFMNVAVTFRHDDSRWIELGGSPAIKAFLRDEFGAVLRELKVA